MNTDNRPSWDEYFMDAAINASRRATCNRKHVGAVIVKDRNIIATGYNGSLPGDEHCYDDNHLMEDGHCVTGDTLISKYQEGGYNSRHRTVRELYDAWNLPARRRGRVRDTSIRCVAPNGVIVPGRITDIWEAGVKSTLTITTFLGRRVTLTRDHRLLTPDGWYSAEQLVVGSTVALNGRHLEDDIDWLKQRYEEGMTVQKIAALVGRSRGLVRRRLLSAGVALRPFSFGGWNRGATHGGSGTYKGRDVTASSARSRARRYALGPSCVVCGDTGALQVHHIDGDHLNDALSNLTTLCVPCHMVAHTPHAKVKSVKFDKVVSIEDAGAQTVYDLTTEPHHNFVGDGFVLHNCVRTVHAEHNAILQAAKHGHATNGATIYTTASPCGPCFKAIVQAGIKKIVFGEVYRDERIYVHAQKNNIILVDMIDYMKERTRGKEGR